MKKMNSEVASIIEKLVQSILFHLGEASVSKVILYGSATDAASFREGESDLDVAVLLMPTATLNDFNACTQIEKIKAEIVGVWRRLDIQLHKCGSIERYRNFELCFQGQVYKGVTLYDAGHPVVTAHEVLTREAAQLEISRGHIRFAFAQLLTIAYTNSAAWSYCRACCSLFHALLALKDVDVSPKAIRWDMDALLAKVVMYYPRLVSLEKHIALLPKGIAQQDLDDFEYRLFASGDDQGFSMADKRRMKAAVLLCIRAAKKEVGDDVFHYKQCRNLLIFFES